MALWLGPPFFLLERSPSCGMTVYAGFKLACVQADGKKNDP